MQGKGRRCDTSGQRNKIPVVSRTTSPLHHFAISPFRHFTSLPQPAQVTPRHLDTSVGAIKDSSGEVAELKESILVRWLTLRNVWRDLTQRVYLRSAANTWQAHGPLSHSTTSNTSPSRESTVTAVPLYNRFNVPCRVYLWSVWVSATG